MLAPPTDDIVIKALATGGLYEGEFGQISMLGSSDKIKWNRTAEGLIIQLPKNMPDQPVIGFRITEK